MLNSVYHKDFKDSSEYDNKLIQQWIFDQLIPEKLFRLLYPLADKKYSWERIVKFGGTSVIDLIFHKLNNEQVKLLFIPEETGNQLAGDRKCCMSVLTVVSEIGGMWNIRNKWNKHSDMLQLLINKCKELGIQKSALGYGAEVGESALHFCNTGLDAVRIEIFENLTGGMDDNQVHSLLLSGISTGHSLVETAINSYKYDLAKHLLQRFIQSATGDQLNEMLACLSRKLNEKCNPRQRQSLLAIYHYFINGLDDDQKNKMVSELLAQPLPLSAVYKKHSNHFFQFVLENIQAGGIQFEDAESVFHLAFEKDDYENIYRLVKGVLSRDQFCQLLTESVDGGVRRIDQVLECYLKTRDCNNLALLKQYLKDQNQDQIWQWMIHESDLEMPLIRILENTLSSYQWELIETILSECDENMQGQYRKKISEWLFSPMDHDSIIPMNRLFEITPKYSGLTDLFLGFIDNKMLKDFLLSVQLNQPDSRNINLFSLNQYALEKVINKLGCSKSGDKELVENMAGTEFPPGGDGQVAERNALNRSEKSENMTDSIMDVVKGLKGESLLHFMFSYDQIVISEKKFEVLQNYGLVIDLLNIQAEKDGSTPIHRLLNAYHDVNYYVSDSFTTTIYIQYMMDKVFKFLNKKGGLCHAMTVRNKKGETPLQLFAANCSGLCNQSLLNSIDARYGIDAPLFYKIAKIKDGDGRTLLHHICLSAIERYRYAKQSGLRANEVKKTLEEAAQRIVQMVEK